MNRTTLALVSAPFLACAVSVPASAAQFECRLSLPSAPQEPLENFPLFVRFSEGDPAGFSYADCPAAANLWFTDAAGEPLPFEADTWNPEGDSIVWVSVPSLSAADAIVMHWSDEADDAPASPAPSAVWSRAGYVGVWHMNELLEESSTGKRYTPDSSASGWHAYKNPNSASSSAYGSPVTNAAAVTAHPRPLTGTAMNICHGVNTFAGGFTVPASATAGTTLGGSGFTLSAIANAQRIADPGWCRVIAFGNAYNEIANLTLGSDYIYCFGPGSGNNQHPANPKGSTGWVLATAAFASASKVYADGVNLSGDGGKPSLTSVTLDKGIGLGSFPSGTQGLDGYLDEARIRNVASTDEWVAEEYRTVADADYVAFGKVVPVHPARRATLILVK